MLYYKIHFKQFICQEWVCLKTIKHFWKVFRYTASFDKKKFAFLISELFFVLWTISDSFIGEFLGIDVFWEKAFRVIACIVISIMPLSLAVHTSLVFIIIFKGLTATHGIIPIVLAVIIVIRDIRGFYTFVDGDYIGRKSSDNKFISNIVEKVNEPLGYEGFEFCKQKLKHGNVFYSKQLNKYLMKKNYIPAVLSQKGYEKVRRYIESNYANILPYFSYYVRKCTNENRMFENNKKLCMSSDIHKNRPVMLHIGGYYDTYVTNIICGRSLLSNDCFEGSVAIPFPKYSFQNKLKSIEFSNMNNEIGVSTIAITSDNCLILFTRNNRTATDDTGLLIPSGSGSANFADYQENNFLQSVLNGINRELLEETSLINKKNIEYTTKITGYFRWMEKGGKPEFVAVTKFRNVTLDDIQCEKSEVCQLQTQDVSFENCKEFKELINRYIHKDNISVPLHMSLLFLQNAMESKYRCEICKLLFK